MKAVETKDSEEKSLKSTNNSLGIIPSEQIIPFKDRLMQVIGDRSVREFSRTCGLSDKTLRDYMNGKSYPTLDRLALIAEASRQPLTWLVTGELAKPTSKPTDAVEVFQYDLKASAGNGHLVVSESPIAKFELSSAWLIEQGLNGKRLTVVPVRGDSMEKTLWDGDLMLVELIDEPSQARDGICVIRIDGEILVKRVQYDYTTGGYNITSDNEAYRSFFIGETFKGDFAIIGKMARVLQRAKVEITSRPI